MSTKKSKVDKPISSPKDAIAVPSNLVQVVGWSVHGQEEGRLGPLFTCPKGKSYYLDTLLNMGFFPVTNKDNIYID
jgi:hypothetical protein